MQQFTCGIYQTSISQNCLFSFWSFGQVVPPVPEEPAFCMLNVQISSTLVFLLHDASGSHPI